MSVEEKSVLIHNLEQKIQRADREYFRGHPFMSDSDYDGLVAKLTELKPNSPVLHRVNDSLLATHEKVKHSKRMVSIKDGFTDQDIIDFCKKVPGPYMCEMKLDGLALCLTYKEGLLHTAVTRGDGFIGDDVTLAARTIRSIPVKLSEPIDLEVRGECIITKKNFTLLPEGFANARNAAAGSLRLKDSVEASKRRMDFVAYSCETDLGESHEERMSWLHTEGFWTVKKIKSWTAKEVIQNMKELSVMRPRLPFDIDGMVIKINDIEKQDSLGLVGKYPRWALAAKFEAPTGVTKLIDIELNIGRTGNITPVGVFEPVHISGSEVSRASLHNNSEIQRKKIGIGCTVTIAKAGDIIPEVVSVIDPDDFETYQMSTLCPQCGSDLDTSQLNWKCTFDSCSIQKTLEFFAGKQCMDIKGMGPSVIEKLVEAFDITETSEILELTDSYHRTQIAEIEGFTFYSAGKLADAIEESCTLSQDRFYRSLCIPTIGESSAEWLANKYKTPKDFIEDLEDGFYDSFSELGPAKQHSIMIWAGRGNNLNNASNVLDKVTFKKEETKKVDNQFVFVFTGKLSEPRTELEKQAKAAGHLTSKSITKACNYLVAGEKAGSKIDKAEKAGVKVINEELFKSLIK